MEKCVKQKVPCTFASGAVYFLRSTRHLVQRYTVPVKKISILSCHDINRHIEDLRNLQDRIDVSSCSSRKVMGRSALAPAVYELSRTAGEACPHVCISEGKDRSFLVDTFSHDELEVSVSVLRDRKIGNRTCVRIELSQISAACLSMEHLHDLHGRFLIGNVRISGSAVSDDRNIVIKIDGVHLFSAS